MGKNITLDNGATLTFTLIASWHDMGRERGWEAQIGGRREDAWCDDGTMGDSKWGRRGDGGENDVKSCFSDLPLTLISAPLRREHIITFKLNVSGSFGVLSVQSKNMMLSSQRNLDITSWQKQHAQIMKGYFFISEWGCAAFARSLSQPEHSR